MFFLNSMCFLCLRSDKKNLKSILSLDIDNVSFEKKLEFCMSELTNIHFEAPMLVCAICQQYINFVYIFKQQSIQNTIRIKKYTDQLKSWKSVSFDKYHDLVVLVSDINELKHENDKKIKIQFDKYIIKKFMSEPYEPKLLHIKTEIKEECVDLEDIDLEETTEFEERQNTTNDELKMETSSNIEDVISINKEPKRKSCIHLLEANTNIVFKKTKIAKIVEENLDSREDEIQSDTIEEETNFKTETVPIASQISENVEEQSLSNLEAGSKKAIQSSINLLQENSNKAFKKIKITEIVEKGLDSDDEEIESDSSEEEINNFDIFKIKRDKITKKFHCAFCTKTYSKSTNIDKHLRKFHIEDKPFQCNVCHAKFQLRSKYKSHVRSHDNRYPCTFCDKKYNRKYLLTIHMKLHSEKPYECLVCLKKFRRKIHYTNHLKIHTGEKQFECADCGKKFTTKDNLAAHIRVHTGARPYECSICGRSFSHWSHRRSHLDAHVGYKRYTCIICPRRFTFKSNLKDHMTSHFEEKLFKCSVCGKQYKKKRYLKEHTKTHSKSRRRNSEKVNCDICGKECVKGVGLKLHLKIHERNDN